MGKRSLGLVRIHRAVALDTGIECSGRAFSKSRMFRFDGSELIYGTRDLSHARESYGSVSGFVPQG